MIIATDKHLGSGSRSVHHGFFGRQQGVSEGVFASLNCGPGSGDAAEKVHQNRSLVAASMGVEVESLVSFYQIHSADCHYISGPIADREAGPHADAMVTDVPGLALSILTADCGPVLFSGEKEDGAPVIGAAHAGWGGAVKGVLEATVDEMQKRGAQTESIRAAVGPCIAQVSYEVSAGFEKSFIEEDSDSEHFFMAGRNEGHLMFDLPGYIAFRLARTGVRQVGLCGIDTYAEEERCFSYRRATHRGEKDYGRQISAIVIKL